MISKKAKLLTSVVTGILLVSLVGCGTQAQQPAQQPAQTPAPQPAQAVALTGAGSSFDYPLFSSMFDEYHKKFSNITVNYQSVGSGAGIKQLSDQTIDFGASDAIMTDDQIKAAKGGSILHIPITLGAVAMTYNVPGAPDHLKISPEVLSNIYLGKITKWNDPKIAADNSGVSLPDLKITVAYRSDGSGTSYIFTNYLSSVSSDWKSKVGSGTSVSWPVGIGGKGSEGVTGVVTQTPGSFGYVELAYAVQNKLKVADIKNKAGKWSAPSVEGASAAAAKAVVPNDMKVVIVNADGDASYPISGFSWVLVYQQQTDKVKGTELMKLLSWMIHDGQKLGPALQYAPLPENLASREDAMLKTVTYQGQPLLK
ncbi:MAG: phosphate ABC transporter substrate-binding protein PstS [Desulfitobacteriaceae bacterium]